MRLPPPARDGRAGTRRRGPRERPHRRAAPWRAAADPEVAGPGYPRARRRPAVWGRQAARARRRSAGRRRLRRGSRRLRRGSRRLGHSSSRHVRGGGRLVGDERSGLVPSRLYRWLLARRLVGHSGGSSPNTRIQIMAATRVDASVASAPNPASIPDHSRRLTKGLSNIVQAFKQTRARWRRRTGSGPAPQSAMVEGLRSPRQMVSTIIDLARSSSASPTGTLSKIQPVSTCSTEP